MTPISSLSQQTRARPQYVMDRQDYDTRMKAILQNDKYQNLRRDPTVRRENTIADTLKRLRNDRHIDDKLYAYLMPRYSTPPPPTDVRPS